MKNKIVWLAEWNNGQDWEDNHDYFIGIYSTKEKAEIVAEEYHKDKIENNQTYNPAKASWHIYQVEIDK